MEAARPSHPLSLPIVPAIVLVFPCLPLFIHLVSLSESGGGPVLSFFPPPSDALAEALFFFFEPLIAHLWLNDENTHLSLCSHSSHFAFQAHSVCVLPESQFRLHPKPINSFHRGLTELIIYYILFGTLS